MATNPAVPAPPTEVTINNTPQEILAAMKASEAATPPVEAPPVTPPPVPAPVVEPQPFTMEQKQDGSLYVKLQTGEEFSGAVNDVIAKLAKSNVDTKIWAKGLKEKAEAQPQTPPAQPPTPAPTNEEAATQEFFQELTANPRGAIAKSVAKELGFESPEQLTQAVSDMRQMSEAIHTQQTASEFYRRCPEFPTSEENVGKLYDYMAKAGIPETVEGLVTAHAACVQFGLYKPWTQEQIQEAYKQAMNPNLTPSVQAARPTPPPVPPVSAAPAAAAPVDPWSMDINELRKLAMREFTGK